MNAGFYFGIQQQKSKNSTHYPTQKEKIQSRKPINCDALLNQNRKQSNVQYQGNFAMRNIRKHDAVYFSEGSE